MKVRKVSIPQAILLDGFTAVVQRKMHRSTTEFILQYNTIYTAVQKYLRCEAGKNTLFCHYCCNF